jgi:DNA polymerase-3 subunit alpha
LLMNVHVSANEMVSQLAHELTGAHGGTGTIRLIVPIAGGGEAVVLLGRDYLLDAELAARIERVTGEGTVDLSVQEPPKLALVG